MRQWRCCGRDSVGLHGKGVIGIRCAAFHSHGQSLGIGLFEAHAVTIRHADTTDDCTDDADKSLVCTA